MASRVYSDVHHNHQNLLGALRRDYEEKFKRSKAAHALAQRVMVDGISHGARLFDPYPFRITSAQGAYVTDLDSHQIIDFWQGHYANILGHNSPVVREALQAALKQGMGLQTGLPSELEIEFASLLARSLDVERVRFTTAGTLATMYAIMLACGFTGRRLVVKMAGGWHGANPMALKGVGRSDGHFQKVDSAGMSANTSDEIVVTRFNDVDGLRQLFASLGERIACLIFEPCLGGAGFIPATPEFMRAARELTEQNGALLILDEVITGFRFCASGIQRLYNVKADLSTLGKIVGGGMPVSLVAGRADVMDLASDKAEKRVWFNGGTFSAHPLSLLAGQTMVEHLIAHEDEIYPDLASKADRLRKGIEQVFADRGILARCTGYGNALIPGGSLSSIYFPRREDFYPASAEDFTDPNLSDVILREQGLKLGLLLHNVNVVHGLGALSTSHTDQDLAAVWEAYDAFALRLSREG